MTSYQPQDRLAVHVTFPAMFLPPSPDRPEGAYKISNPFGEPYFVPATSALSVEAAPKPALPTSVGSLIVAEVPGFAQLPVVLHLTARRDSDPSWLDTSTGTWVDAGLIERWTLLDRDGLHTVEAPLALPTGIGAVVRTRNLDGEGGIAIFTGYGPFEWRFVIPGYADSASWMESSRVALRLIEVLSPGIEVESP